MGDSGKTLLLVEDEAIIALSEKKMLEKQGYKVIVASNGQRAVDICRDSGGRIDLVLMDIDLGEGLDGTQAAEEILSSHDLPLLFLSSHTEPEVVEKTEGITSYGYVTKSSGITVLQAAIGMAFKLHQAKQDVWEKSMELEGAYEELTATNEELISLNDDLMTQEKALQQSEERYRTLFDNMQNGFAYHQVIYDGQGKVIDYRFLKTNPAFERLTGLKAVDGKLISQIIPGIHQSDPELLSTYAQVAAGGKQVVIETFVAAMDDWYQITAYCPEVGYFVTIFSKTTKEHQAEMAISKSEALLKELCPIAQIGGWEFDPITGEGAWTEQVAIIHEVDPADSTDVQFGLDFYQGESKKRIAAAVQAAIQDGEPYDLVLEMRTAKGNQKWVRTIGRPIVEDGKVVKVRGTIQDVTDRKRGELEMDRRQNFIDRILDTTPNLIYIYDIKEQRNTYCNREILSFLGHSAEDIAKMGSQLFANVVHSDDLPVTAAHHQRMAQAEDREVHQCQYRMRHADGQWRLLRSTDVVFSRDNDGSVREILGTTEDITEQDKLEQAYRQKAEENQLLLVELQHRVKNNLNLVISLIDLGMDKISDPASRQVCKDAQGRIQSMSKLYESLYHSGNMEIIDLGEYVEDFAHRLLDIYMLQSDGVTLSTEVMPLSYSSKRAVSLGLALNEAIANALKYAFGTGPKGKILVRLWQEDDWANLAIEDNGQGLPKEWDWDAAEGVGHTLMRSLLEQVGGRAQVSSIPGEGTKVVFTFPMENASQ